MRLVPIALFKARFLGLVVCLTCLSACIPSTETLTRTDSYQPGLDIGGDAVDGLTVGHRLMASGEHDLALRAYYRAAADLGLNVDVLSAVGSANLKLGRIGQAETILRRAIEEDPDFVPAINNLGVVLMEQGEYGEARLFFRQAFALDSGRTDAIRDNLRLAIARMEDSVYAPPEQEYDFDLIRRGPGVYELLAPSG